MKKSASFLRLVTPRPQAHVQNPNTPPLLIFPEGTCVNNEYCVMFKRGAFDLGATVSSPPFLPFVALALLGKRRGRTL
jgi:1-acyl-sn-glycerol-3-phosphate acyltransferase